MIREEQHDRDQDPSPLGTRRETAGDLGGSSNQPTRQRCLPTARHRRRSVLPVGEAGQARSADGRWRMDYVARHPPADFGPASAPSKWVTLEAMTIVGQLFT